MNAIGENLNTVILCVRFELFSAHSHTVYAQKCYIVVIPHALMVYLIYTPSALWPVALRLWVYVSG